MKNGKTRSVAAFVVIAFVLCGVVLAAGCAGKRKKSVLQPASLPMEEISGQVGKELELDCGAGVTMKLALIPAGEFMMGSPPSEIGREDDEGPPHRVRISRPFYMGKYEVTQAQYEAVMGNDPASPKGAKSPFTGASWYDAVEFCKRLSARTGMTVRLPTEAEWEYACRAGTTTVFCFGDTISTDQANYNGDDAYGSGPKGVNRRKTTAVGSFSANRFGLYDMHGNVWEWCQDWYDQDYYRNSPTSDPPGPANGQYRVLRGGSWVHSPWRARSAYRGILDPERRATRAGGLRICVVVPE